MPIDDQNPARKNIRPGTSTVCLIVKNEKPYLPEWLAWHQMLGFNRIVVYDNNSSDGSSALLQAMDAKGLIDYRAWELGRLESPQLTAYQDAITRLDTEWVYFADIDEFLVLHRHRTVGDFLDSFAGQDDIDAIGINWRIFGDSFQKTYRPGPCIERFTWASGYDFIANRHFKSFTRTDRIQGVISRHLCAVEGRRVHASGRPMESLDYGYTSHVDLDVAQINHYYGKTFQEYRRKMVRGQAGVGEVDAVLKYAYTPETFRIHNENVMIDRTAFRRLEELKAEMARWEALFPEGSFAFEPMAGDLVPLEPEIEISWPEPDEVDVQDGPEAAPPETGSGDDGVAALLETALELRLFEPLTYRMLSDAAGDDLALFRHYLAEGWRFGLNPSDRFSTSHYLADYPALADEDLNPLLHYLNSRAVGQRLPYRDTEGRVVFDVEDLDPDFIGFYFSSDYYALQTGEDHGGDEAALRHYLEQGWLLGYDPSANFSTRGYLETYPDVAEANLNPLAHFIRTGSAEGRVAPTPVRPAAPAAESHDAVRAAFNAVYYRRQVPGGEYLGDDELFENFMNGDWQLGYEPSPDFSMAFYLRANKDIAQAKINPFQHYVLAGREEGRASVLAGREREALDRQVDIFADWASSQPFGRSRRGEDRASRLMAWGVADFAWLARTLKMGPNARAIAEAVLKMKPAARPQLSRLHDPDFVAWHYGHLAVDGDVLAGLLDAGLKDPPVFGRAQLERDTAIITGLGSFDRVGYEQQLRRTGLERGEFTAEEHFVLYGSNLDLSPDGVFDTAFYRRLSRAANPSDTNPYVHYLLSKRLDYTFANAEGVMARVKELREVEDFDEALYREQENLPPDADARVHYALTGNRSRARILADFDSSRYLTTYPDIGRGGNNGLLHFTRSGRAEGRTGAGNRAEERVEGGGQLLGGSQSVLVFSHEASRTGAPIVALNLAKALAERYKVVTWTGKTGPLTPDFRSCASDHIASFVNGCIGDDILDQLSIEHNFAFAIVNSIVSHPMIGLLNRHNIPVISLIHEFASTVYPEGTTARAAIRSGATVFPAAVVEDDFRDELRNIGMVQGVPNVVRIPQGSNQPPTAGFSEDELNALKRRFGIKADGTSRVVFGAGSVNLRKGVDLFIQTAAALATDTVHDWRFIWVGGGYDPTRDMGYSIFLREQLRKSGLEGRMFFVGEQPNLDLYWAISDIFLMSSRLDPFPNVVIDSIVKHVPVVCFDGATGAADVMPDLPFAVFTAPYMDAAGAAKVCREVVAKEKEIRKAFSDSKERIAAYFSFERYVERLEALVPAARTRARQRTAIRAAIRDQSDPASLDIFNLAGAARFVATGDAGVLIDQGTDILLCDDYRPYFAEADGRPLLSSFRMSAPARDVSLPEDGDADSLDYTPVIWGAPQPMVHQRVKALPGLQRLQSLIPVVCTGSEGEGGFGRVFSGEDLVIAMQNLLAELGPEWLLNLAGPLSLPMNGDAVAGAQRLVLPVRTSLDIAGQLAAAREKPVAILMPATLNPPVQAERERLKAIGYDSADIGLNGLSGFLHGATLGRFLAGFGEDWSPFVTRPWTEQMREIELRFYEFCAREKLVAVRHPHF